MPVECRYIERPETFSAVSEGDPTSWPPITVKQGHPFAKQFTELRHLARKEDMFYTTEHCVTRYVPAPEYVMVGNDPRVKGQSQDAHAAELAGWRFIREDDFAAGQR
jgi:hypothetical protein